MAAGSVDWVPAQLAGDGGIVAAATPEVFDLRQFCCRLTILLSPT
jgi:hypothetical protein